MMKILFAFLTAICIYSCSYSEDGPISIYPEELEGDYSGFALFASLDSGNFIHLRKDTLRIVLDSIWTLSNCFLEDISFEESEEDSILFLKPIIHFSLSATDCASPLFFPETLISIPPSDSWKSYQEIRVMDSQGELEDSIFLRNGDFLKDTFEIYIDSSFADPYLLPRKTKGEPSILKKIDSLQERTFYWRTMESRCTYIVDTCETKLDTLYPNSWSLRDTNLVPIRLTCKDSTLRYCLQRDWKNDSLALGKLNERLDTLWYYSWFLIQEMPKGGMLNKLSYSNISHKTKVQITEEIFKPESEKDYITNPDSSLMFYDLRTGEKVSYDDSLYSVFKNAEIGRDTL